MWGWVSAQSWGVQRDSRGSGQGGRWGRKTSVPVSTVIPWIALALPYFVALGGCCAQGTHYPTSKAGHVAAVAGKLGLRGGIVLMPWHLQVCAG